MSMLYKLYQLNRTFKDGRQDNSNGKWYARAIHLGTVETSDLAKEIAYSTTATEADVLAVINALVHVMKQKLADSYIVKLNGLGSFKVGIKCSGATDLEEFTVAECIKGARINFMPAYTINSATGARSVGLLDAVRYKETAKNDVGIEKA